MIFFCYSDLIKCMNHQGLAYPLSPSIAVYHQILDPSLDNLDLNWFLRESVIHGFDWNYENQPWSLLVLTWPPGSRIPRPHPPPSPDRDGSLDHPQVPVICLSNLIWSIMDLIWHKYIWSPTPYYGWSCSGTTLQSVQIQSSCRIWELWQEAIESRECLLVGLEHLVHGDGAHDHFVVVVPEMWK